MKTVVSVSMETSQVLRIDTAPLVKDVGRSGVIRLAVSEFYEKREKSEKAENEKSKGEK